MQLNRTKISESSETQHIEKIPKLIAIYLPELRLLSNFCLTQNPLFFYVIIGRNFEYDEALKIVQFEEYTEDINFDEIKRYDVQKRIGNLESQKLNLHKGRKHVGKNLIKHHGRNPRKKSGKIPQKILQKILQKNEDNIQNKKKKVTNKFNKRITK